jgi:hypothetical protein
VSAPSVRIVVEYDDDASAAAEALLALLRRPANPEPEENGDPESEAA